MGNSLLWQAAAAYARFVALVCIVGAVAGAWVAMLSGEGLRAAGLVLFAGWGWLIFHAFSTQAVSGSAEGLAVRRWGVWTTIPWREIRSLEPWWATSVYRTRIIVAETAGSRRRVRFFANRDAEAALRALHEGATKR